MKLTRRQAICLWHAITYEEPVTEESAKVTPATQMLRFFEVPTIFSRGDPLYEKYIYDVARFLREFANALEKGE